VNQLPEHINISPTLAYARFIAVQSNLVYRTVLICQDKPNLVNAKRFICLITIIFFYPFIMFFFVVRVFPHKNAKFSTKRS